MRNSIAIVGIGGVFPGAANLDSFWEMISSGGSAAREIPPDRWILDPAQAGSSEVSADKVNSTRGCFIDDFPFETSGMDLDPTTLAGLDPAFHLLLHAGRLAWQDAATTRLDRKRVGVVIGNIVLPTDASSALTDEILGPIFASQVLGQAIAEKKDTLRLNRYVAGLPAGVLAKGLQLGGGSYALDAACASSLYALKYAAEELLAGRADAMLAGGLSRPDCLYTQMGFSQLQAISRSGRCSPFDYRADGLVVGEGAGIIVLKRLQDALDQGDQIYATIAGIDLSNDVGGNLMSPDSEGQQRAMLAAYQQAGWSPGDVDLIECHGTGTPIGDAVEFNSLQSLWQDLEPGHRRCVIGSVKSNVGHLLTAAGSAGLIKLLLAMKHRQLPPTANFERPASGVALKHSPFEVLIETREWVRRAAGTPRRAAISAFGFGGINAHVLLQEWGEGETAPGVAAKQAAPAIAVVGMEAQFGPWRCLEQFRKRVFGFDRDQQACPPENGWGVEPNNADEGFFLNQVAVPLGRYRIPPAELREMLPQQLLMLQVASAALEDAGLGEAEAAARNTTAVYIGIGLDLNTTNFHFRWSMLNRARDWNDQLGLNLSDADLESWTGQLREAAGPPLNANRTMGALGGIVASRIARAFHMGGPSFSVSSEEASGLRALEAGVRALQRGEIETAVVGAVDLAGDVRAIRGQIEDRPLSSDMPIGEGASALVLKRHQDAVRDGDRIYALVEGVGAATEGGVEQLLPSQDAYQISWQRACDDAGAAPDSIGLIERHGSGIAAEEAMENQALNELLAASKRALPCAQASIKSSIGHCGAAGGLASVVRACLALHHQTLPPRGAAGQAKYWLHDQAEGPRRAAVASFSIDGNCLHAILGAVDQQTGTQPRAIHSTLPAALFTLAAASDEELLTQLQQLESRLQAADDLHQMAHDGWQSHQGNGASCSRLSLLAADPAVLAKQIDLARQAVSDQQSIATHGVFYAVEPIGENGKIAFVYPGSGNHFHHMGRELALQWPAVLDRLNRENDSLGSQFAQGRFWQDSAATELDHAAVIFGQVWVGTLVSDMVAQFGLQPDAVIGYSLGETAGLFSTRTWTDRDEMLHRMRTTDLFTRQLAGPCQAVRESWGLEESESVDWLIGMVGRPADAVRTALQGKERVYLLIVNTPQECVIGGDRRAVLALAQELNCVFHPVQGVTTVHCEVARPVEEAYRELHLFATTPPAGVSFYSGAWGRSYTVNSASCADSILQQALRSFDYTKVIESAYTDGARIFIEMGPGASCTRMIDQILGQRRHLAAAICVPSQDDVLNVLELLARLHAEGLALDLTPLFCTRPVQSPRLEEGARIVVASGGQAFDVPAPPTTAKPREDVRFAIPGQTRAVAVAGAVVTTQDPAGGLLTALIDQIQATEKAKTDTHEAFLRVSNGLTVTLTQALSMEMSLLQSGLVPVTMPVHDQRLAPTPIAFDRSQCMEFAIGSIGKVLGTEYADADRHPSRVRLPDEPLMLVDRILKVEGTRNSMGPGRVTTEHDVLAGAWYLDGGRIPTCIAVEAGQADLFLAAYLGIDHHTKGQAVYRLLDAKITFHGPLPRPGDTIRYDIRIDHFFRQDQTWLFRFGFEGTVSGRPVLTMTEGCAGFFTQAELDAGRGIVETSLERRSMPGKMPEDWLVLVPMHKESFDDDQIAALVNGDLQACFGSAFAGLGLKNAAGLPAGRMQLVHRILELDPTGGRFGIGQITGEADIQPDDWFLTCHFSDDPVMPGTLMYECCLHTLRVYLLRMGWVGEADEMVYEPVQGEISQLKCRGQVLAGTRSVQYRITLKEIGYQDDGTPFVLANALISADGRAIVQMNNMSVQLTGLSRVGLESLWAGRNQGERSGKPLFDVHSIYAFACGKPSEAFGEHYRMFDQQRVIARLPGPPYQFLDRIVAIDNCRQWVLTAGGEVVAEYDVPADCWYFEQDRQQRMPFAVLLEVALQPCGWLAAYLGSALTSDIDLSFRNLGGSGRQSMLVTPDTGTLATRIKITNVSQSGGIIIQSYDLEVSCAAGMVYQGVTTFGFFSKPSLADQVGIREAQLWQTSEQEQARGRSFSYPQLAPYPDRMMRMVQEVELFDPEGGQHELGFIRGTTRVDADAWFFKAHFYQDPVWPGSLGLESLIQLLKVVALDRWQDRVDGQKVNFEGMALGHEHSWIYRGQIIPTDRQVTVEATILAFDDHTMTLQANGFLSVDGRIIYQMNSFALKMSC
ncbi:MAG: beta-ketoacyl synthase N-terminal-like domain-containing protein [Xanthomonadales bacterium]